MTRALFGVLKSTFCVEKFAPQNLTCVIMADTHFYASYVYMVTDLAFTMAISASSHKENPYLIYR
jgi:hypothetical protein